MRDNLAPISARGVGQILEISPDRIASADQRPFRSPALSSEISGRLPTSIYRTFGDPARRALRTHGDPRIASDGRGRSTPADRTGYGQHLHCGCGLPASTFEASVVQQPALELAIRCRQCCFKAERKFFRQLQRGSHGSTSGHNHRAGRRGIRRHLVDAQSRDNHHLAMARAPAARRAAGANSGHVSRFRNRPARRGA